MKLIIDISEYNVEYIKNAYRIPQDINMVIAEAIINGKQIPTPHRDLVDLSDIVHPNDSMRCMTIDEQLRRTCEGWDRKQYVVIGAEREIIT